MKCFLFSITLLAVGAASPCVCLAEIITSYSEMPSDIITLYPDFLDWSNPDHFGKKLAAQGIGFQLWHVGESRWYSSGGFASGLSGFYASYLNSDIAPYNSKMYDQAVRFILDQPVFAVGGTFFATNNPPVDAPTSFDNNVFNVTHEVMAYDVHGGLIETATSSSYGNIVGPVEYGTASNSAGPVEFMASYAGIWTKTPVYSVVFTGVEPNGDIQAHFGSFSFSRTAIPEPSTFVTFAELLGLGLIGYCWRHRKRAG